MRDECARRQGCAPDLVLLGDMPGTASETSVPMRSARYRYAALLGVAAAAAGRCSRLASSPGTFLRLPPVRTASCASLAVGRVSEHHAADAGRCCGLPAAVLAGAAPAAEILRRCGARRRELGETRLGRSVLRCKLLHGGHRACFALPPRVVRRSLHTHAGRRCRQPVPGGAESPEHDSSSGAAQASAVLAARPLARPTLRLASARRSDHEAEPASGDALSANSRRWRESSPTRQGESQQPKPPVG
jgi:hypothetical protein